MGWSKNEFSHSLVLQHLTRDDRPVGLVPRALFLQRTTRAAPGPVVNVTEGVSQHGGFQRYENVVDNFSRPANNPARQRRSTVIWKPAVASI